MNGFFMNARGVVLSSLLLASVAPAAHSAGTQRFIPGNGASDAYPDAELGIVFDARPVLGTSGRIRVYRAVDRVLVDSIDVSEASTTASGETQTAMPRTNTEIDAIGGAVTTIDGRARWVYYSPVKIAGNRAGIELHDGKLAYGTSYYVVIDAGVLRGSIRGVAFDGVSDPSAWTFTTRHAPSSVTDVSVGMRGPTDFRSIQAALNWIMAHCSNSAPVAYGCNTGATQKRVRIAAGVFEELLFLRDVDNISLIGAGRRRTQVQYENFDNYNPGTGVSDVKPLTTMSAVGTGTRRRLGGGRSVLLIEDSDFT